MEYKLDEKDKQILTELDLNARIPLTQLAKKVKLSVQVVKYRIEKLEKDNIIQQYYAIIDVKKIGLTIYGNHLKFQHLSTEEEKKWIKEINENPRTMGVAKIMGEWDVGYAMLAKNNDEVNDIQIEVTKGRKDKILKSVIFSEKYSTYYNMNLFNYKINSPISTDKNAEEIKIDEIDQKLIKELSDNCRQSLIELTPKLNLSPNGVKERIKNLEKKGIIIGYKTKINYEELGYMHFRVLLHLKNPISSVLNNIQSYVGALGNVESVNIHIGYDDLNFRCYVKSIIELHELVAKLKDNFIDEIISTEYVLFFGWNSMKYYLQD